MKARAISLLSVWEWTGIYPVSWSKTSTSTWSHSAQYRRTFGDKRQCIRDGECLPAHTKHIQYGHHATPQCWNSAVTAWFIANEYLPGGCAVSETTRAHRGKVKCWTTGGWQFYINVVAHVAAKVKGLVSTYVWSCINAYWGVYIYVHIFMSMSVCIWEQERTLPFIPSRLWQGGVWLKDAHPQGLWNQHQPSVLYIMRFGFSLPYRLIIHQDRHYNIVALLMHCRNVIHYRTGR